MGKVWIIQMVPLAKESPLAGEMPSLEGQDWERRRHLGFWTKIWGAKQDTTLWDKFHPYKSKAENPKSFGDGHEPIIKIAISELLICAK